MSSSRKLFINRSAIGLLTISLWLVLAAIATGPMGCGGSHNDSGSNPSPTSPAGVGRATVSILWPKPTRLIPGAAQSIVIRILQGKTVLATKTLARPDSGGTATATFESLPVGTLTATSTAYPNADGSGTAQATASTPVVIAIGAVTPFSLTMDSTITKVVISPSTTQLSVGETTTLTATPQDKTGATVLVGPSNITWASSNPSAVTVDSNGAITAVSVGSSSLTATESESGKSAHVTVAVVAVTPSPSPSPSVSPLPSPSPSPVGGRPQFATGVTYPVPTPGEQVTTGDFDKDGKVDVAVGSSSGLLIFYGKGDGTLEDSVVINAHTTFGVRCAADINNDGRLDILCGDNNGVYVYLNNGGRNFASSISLNIGTTISIVAIPVPGLANKEIAAVMQNPDLTGSVHLMRLQGSTLQEVATYTVPQLPIAVAAGDLTNDGLSDLVVTFLTSIVDQSGAVVFPGLANGTFGAGTRYNTGTMDPVGADINDFNGDGRPDLAVTNYWDNNVALLLNNGGTTLATPLHYFSNGYPRYVHSADFDRDGKRDMVVANAGSDDVTVVWNRGDTFTPITFPTGGSNSRSLDVADFNNDGKMDIVVGSESSNTISILLNTTL